MKLINYLSKTINELEGSLIGIGIEEEKLINKIDKNDKILVCNLLNSFNKSSTEKGRIKKISIRKLRKKFKKRKNDYIICNINSVERFTTKFVYDSIYICKNEIIVYSKEKDYIFENIIRRYGRYSVIDEITCEDGIAYKIKIIKKTNKINEKFYTFIDGLITIVDIITELLS